ncbi:MAG: hypothetical protein Fur0046_22330 [Cyanobacteria bacterium J069]|nr:MAG: type I secretion C-terminal target domain-containing protein [Cyanobacteria bacterium J069]
MSTPGKLDTTFSNDGRVTFGIDGTDQARKVLVQADGKILVIGDSSNDFSIARLTAEGSLDNSFNSRGTAVLDFRGTQVLRDAVLQSDGKLILVGDSDSDFAVIRLNLNGTLDNSFAGDGSQSTNFGATETARKVLLQKDGRILVVGESTSTFGSSSFAVARYRTDGSRDTSFSSDGRTSTSLGATALVNDALLQEDGKLVVAGGDGSAFTLVRYRTDGSLDRDFGDRGIVRTRISNNGVVGFSVAQKVLLQPDGKLLAVGTSNDDFALIRYNSNGSLDRNFGRSGVRTTDFGGFFSAVDAVTDAVLQPDGKILVVGTSGGQVALARYNPNGSSDDSFSGNGRQTTNLGSNSTAKKVLLQPNGKILVLAVNNGNAVLLRYNSNGSLDNSFDGNGRVTTDLDAADNNADIALQPNGDIVLAGTDVDFSDRDFSVRRYVGDRIDVTLGTPIEPIDFTNGLPGVTRNGTARNDRVLGTGGNDILRGKRGNDIVNGKAGNDRLFGSEGNDSLIGRDGRDELIGGNGDDTLRGGKRGDILIGGRGADVLTGGQGADMFVFNNLNEAGDLISDFTAQDRIDLRGIFRRPNFSAPSAFAQYNQFLRLVQNGSSTEVQIDSDGSGLRLEFTTLVTLRNVPLSSVSAQSFVIA